MLWESVVTSRLRGIGAQRKGVVLGAREEEVGTLVAQGLSNKDIAARLFLSVRTVETHVHHLLNKLGVNSRTQIAVWFSSGAHPSSTQTTSGGNRCRAGAGPAASPNY